MTICALHHVQLAMPNGQEEKARAFYAEVLGLSEVRKPEHLAKRGGAWFRSASAEIHLGVDPDFRPAKKAHPALLVDDLTGLADRCKAAGYEVTSDQPLPGYDRLYVADPFGNRIELLQPAAQRARSGRPQTGEYADYAAKDFEFVAGDDAIEALQSSRDEALALFRSASAPPYAPGKWTMKEILGHLIDDERIFAYRALCVARDEPRELPGFDEKTYAAAAESEQRSIESLLDEYQAVRASTIAFLASLTPEQWLRRGVVNGYPASVRGLAFHIASHELHHLRIIRERYL
jgi:catechol 2,3-dioxygenase-like lactoylglutathione lyase family enzyme